MTTAGAAIFAGESSGDVQGAHLVRAIGELAPHLRWWGVGGPALRQAGVELLHDTSAWGAIGFLESFKKGLGIAPALLHCYDALTNRSPRLVVLVDFGAFNSRIARRAHEIGIAVFWYLPPGSWARNRRPPPSMARFVDCVATPFPWSEQNLRAAGVNAHWVGHPLLDTAQPPSEADAPARRRAAAAALDLDPARLTIAYFPASRTTEIRDIWPTMAGTLDLLAAEHPETQHLVGVAPSIATAALQRYAFTAHPRIAYTRDVYQALSAADLVLTKSGTITLEAALYQKPMVIIYRGNWLMNLEYRLCYRNRLPTIGLPNLLAQQPICPERMGKHANPKELAALLSRWIREPDSTLAIRSQLRQVRALLGQPGASQRAARLAVDLVASTRSSPSTR